ncbi:hypothetical protein CPB86DRAFT_360707 [Serendipita vermifera]|nr:hypothetical protein CPB86DRAFT_360707 [Serendipita vermifera]
MDGGSDSAVQRTPQEVWWTILEEAIDVPVLFDTKYEGNDWSSDARKTKVELYGLYYASEEQRKIIGSVCRSWQSFARSKRDRYVLMLQSTGWEMGNIPKAREIFIYTTYALHSPLAQGKIVEWEKLRMNIPKTLPMVISMLSCPRLRRLEMSFSDRSESTFTDILRVLPEVTWLD